MLRFHLRSVLLTVHMHLNTHTFDYLESGVHFELECAMEVSFCPGCYILTEKRHRVKCFGQVVFRRPYEPILR